MKRIILAILLVCGVYSTAQAQTQFYGSPVVSQKFSLSGTGASANIPLTAGQSVCYVTVANTTSFAGLTLRAQVASDGPYNPATWSNVTAIDGGGITSVGTYGANITSVGLTNFRVNVTTLSSGTVNGTMSCSAVTGAGQHEYIDNSPTPVFTPTPKNIGPQPGQPVISYQYLWNGTQWDGILLDPSDALETTQGGTHVFRITNTSPTACTNIASGKGRIVRIWNSGPATTIYPQFYDEASNSCAAADILWGDGASLVLPSGATVLSLEAPLANGLTVRLSAALSTSQTILISTYGLGY